jgi:hypothetical protein
MDDATEFITALSIDAERGVPSAALSHLNTTTI